MAHQVLAIIQPQGLGKSFRGLSSEEQDDHLGENYRNQYSQKSLLTEAIRASSEQSNADSFEQECLSQILLKPRFQDYSLAERSIIEDELEKFTLRSVQCGVKGKEKEKQKIQTSFMQESASEDKENREEKRRKQKRLKREFSQCSKCEIF